MKYQEVLRGRVKTLCWHPKGSSLEIGKRILVDVDRENGISIYVVQVVAIVESLVTDTLQCARNSYFL